MTANSLPELFLVSAQQDSNDCEILFISSKSSLNTFTNTKLAEDISSFALIDNSVFSPNSVTLIPSNSSPSNRLVLCIVPSLTSDTADPRIFYDLARSAIRKAISVGARKPVLTFHITDLPEDFKYAVESSLLGTFQELYIPLQAREFSVKSSIDAISIIGIHQDQLTFASAIEIGKIVARDIGGADPERMAPLKCAEYIENEFSGTGVSVEVIDGYEVLKKEYPLLAAVSRASMPVQNHRPCVVKLEYRSSDQSKVKENLFFVGKGVTYDTGGADVKYGGGMRGMSRDKCGASGTAGFMRTLSILKPQHINATAYLGFVRNSIGSASYVSDEIILSRAGVRVLVVNTDAEGRMVMADLLCEAKEKIRDNKLENAKIFTVATLTGHVIRAYGHYGAGVDNGPAKKLGISQKIAQGGNLLCDPFEISSLRREDFGFIAPGEKTEDVYQVNEKASSATSRGHQFPAAFLAVASGLYPHHTGDSEFPIAYTHLDIAGSAEEPSGVGLSLPKVTGSPVAALAGTFLLK